MTYPDPIRFECRKCSGLFFEGENHVISLCPTCLPGNEAVTFKVGDRVAMVSSIHGDQYRRGVIVGVEVLVTGLARVIVDSDRGNLKAREFTRDRMFPWPHGDRCEIEPLDAGRFTLVHRTELSSWETAAENHGAHPAKDGVEGSDARMNGPPDVPASEGSRAPEQPSFSREALEAIYARVQRRAGPPAEFVIGDEAKARYLREDDHPLVDEVEKFAAMVQNGVRGCVFLEGEFDRVDAALRSIRSAFAVNTPTSRGWLDEEGERD